MSDSNSNTARNENWTFAREMADIVSAKAAEVMRVNLSEAEQHNMAYAIYVEMCSAQNDRE
jgi:hypothetical protein